MGRIKGSKDLKKRKVSGYRNRWKKFHKKHKRKTRKQRKTGNYIPYKSKRHRDGNVKVWFWEVREMQKEKIKNFPRKSRAKIRKIVYVPFLRVDLHPDFIRNVEALGQTAVNVLGCEGEFIMKMWSPARNKWRCTARQVARIIIRDTPTGLKAFVTSHFRISRYWFWQKT